MGDFQNNTATCFHTVSSFDYMNPYDIFIAQHTTKLNASLSFSFYMAIFASYQTTYIFINHNFCWRSSQLTRHRTEFSEEKGYYYYYDDCYLNACGVLQWRRHKFLVCFFSNPFENIKIHYDFFFGSFCGPFLNRFSVRGGRGTL